MTTRKEIEEYLDGLGIKIKPFKEKLNLKHNYKQNDKENNNSYRVLGYNVDENDRNYYTMKILNKDAENALLDLISDAIIKEDWETAITAIQVLKEESYFYKHCGGAAVRKGIPLEKQNAFFLYCQKNNIEFSYEDSISAYKSSAHNNKRAEKDDEER